MPLVYINHYIIFLTVLRVFEITPLELYTKKIILNRPSVYVSSFSELTIISFPRNFKYTYFSFFALWVGSFFISHKRRDYKMLPGGYWTSVVTYVSHKKQTFVSHKLHGIALERFRPTNCRLEFQEDTGFMLRIFFFFLTSMTYVDLYLVLWDRGYMAVLFSLGRRTIIIFNFNTTFKKKKLIFKNS